MAYFIYRFRHEREICYHYVSASYLGLPVIAFNHLGLSTFITHVFTFLRAGFRLKVGSRLLWKALRFMKIEERLLTELILKGLQNSCLFCVK